MSAYAPDRETPEQSAHDEQGARLSDRILSALNLALDQQDTDIAETLARALERAMTRNTGGAEFGERRTHAPDIEAALERLETLKRD